MRINLLLCAVLSCAAVSQAHADLPKTITGKDGSTMVLVPAGDFIMGTSVDREDAGPPHVRTLPAYYIDRTEVTTEQYARFVNETGTQPPPDWEQRGGQYAAPAGREQLPVTNISWFDAMRYAMWAGKRLPSEAEWEKAARGTDGRLFPWGNTDDPERRHMSDTQTSSTFHGVGPVGRFPQGVSPYGCLDMSGNAWEWTADWFDKYPGTSARSVHFGRQYKVIRGGSALGFYGAPNSGTCVQRARLVPYGAHDSLGFRCVVDVDAARPAYEPGTLLKQVEDQLTGTLTQPVQLSYEQEFEQYKQGGRVPLSVAGESGRDGHVRTGFPLPQGMMKDVGGLRLLDSKGQPVPVQASVLSRWGDDSVRWALLDFVGMGGGAYEVEFGGAVSSPESSEPSLRMSIDQGTVSIDTGSMRVDTTMHKNGGPGVSGLVCTMTIDGGDGKAETWRALAADKMEIESSGPLHGVVRLQGFMGSDEDRPAPFRYDLRVHATAGSSRLNLLLTLVHHAERARPFDTAAPVINVSDVTFAFETNGASQTVLGTDAGTYMHPANEAVELLQPDDLRYVIGPPGQQVAVLPKQDLNQPVEYLGEAKLATRTAPKLEAPVPDERKGTRAPGWVAQRTSGGWTMLGVRHFWQNCPKALFSTPDSLGVRLWAGNEPFDWEAGLAKTHEIVIELRDAAPESALAAASDLSMDLDPLRAVIAPAWICGTAAAGAIMPRTAESLQTFPYWETWRETDMYRWANAMPAGFRDFGDGYMGGPYKGKNAFQDLEYDIPLNFLLQFIRTGQPWYLRAAEPMVRHQADIDTDNFSGRQWKHSPQHTTTEAEFGHVFCRGMLLHYLLTGERRSLEGAMRIGDWMAPMLERGEGVGNERQIGWSLYALTGLYEVTREPRYLRAAEALCKRLMDGQAPTGKFDIRWDNRIAFFNGIAMNGMLTVAEQNGDARLAECVMRVARRTLGFYPEYAARTLNAFCWALEQTDDPRYLDAMHRVWNSTMEFLLDRNVESVETHAWKFPRFAARYRLFSMFDGEPPALPEPGSWRAVRLENAEATVCLRVGDTDASVLVIREGLDQGKVELLNNRGEVVVARELNETSGYFQAAALALPAGGDYMLRLTSHKAYAWQVQHDDACRLVVVDATGGQIPHVLPRAFCYLRDGCQGVKVRFEAMGEGFHSAVLYDPAGKPVSAVRHFIDFGDVNRYEIELQAAVAGDPAGWSLEISNLKVLSTEGLLPYYAAGAADLFNPERQAGTSVQAR